MILFFFYKKARDGLRLSFGLEGEQRGWAGWYDDCCYCCYCYYCYDDDCYYCYDDADCDDYDACGGERAREEDEPADGGGEEEARGAGAAFGACAGAIAACGTYK